MAQTIACQRWIARPSRRPHRRPPRSPHEIAALEWTATAGWPAPRHATRLGDWLLRAADGWTGRATRALPLGDPGLPLAEASPRSAVVRGTRPAARHDRAAAAAHRRWTGALDERGWTQSPRTLVQAAPAGRALTGADAGGTPGHRAGRAWLAMVAGRKGALPAAAPASSPAPGQVRFATRQRAPTPATARSAEAADPRAGAAVAIARGVVGDGWLHLALIEVAPSAPAAGAGPAGHRGAGRVGGASWAPPGVPAGGGAQHGGGRALRAAGLHHPPQLRHPYRGLRQPSAGSPVPAAPVPAAPVPAAPVRQPQCGQAQCRQPGRPGLSAS